MAKKWASVTAITGNIICKSVYLFQHKDYMTGKAKKGTGYGPSTLSFRHSSLSGEQVSARRSVIAETDRAD